IGLVSALCALPHVAQQGYEQLFFIFYSHVCFLRKLCLNYPHPRTVRAFTYWMCSKYVNQSPMIRVLLFFEEWAWTLNNPHPPLATAFQRQRPVGLGALTPLLILSRNFRFISRTTRFLSPLAATASTPRPVSRSR